jgi:type IV secretion system protein VirB9
VNHLKFIINCLLIASSVSVGAQDSARTVQYHSQDIVPIRAKLKYTTLIELPATEKIMEAATGDKDFWIVDVVGNFCFVQNRTPALLSGMGTRGSSVEVYPCWSRFLVTSYPIGIWSAQR